MLNGKEVSRATRTHIILYGTLMGLIISKQFDPDTEKVFKFENLELPPVLSDLVNIVQKSMSGERTINKIQSSHAFLEVVEKNNLFEVVHSESKTSLLWLQYIHAVEVFLRFPKGEITSDWALHLQSAREMMPYFAASGHYLYAKSTYLYLQTMTQLHHTHPQVQKRFEEGFHAVRKSNRYWAGLSSDLIIEEFLMRSVKTLGGLTRGRGMNELQRSIWLLSTPVTAEINRAMQEFSGVKYESSDQHKDVSPTRIERDHVDAQYLYERNPFEIL